MLRQIVSTMFKKTVISFPPKMTGSHKSPTQYLLRTSPPCSQSRLRIESSVMLREKVRKRRGRLSESRDRSKILVTFPQHRIQVTVIKIKRKGDSCRDQVQSDRCKKRAAREIRSIHENSNMTPKLQSQNCKFISQFPVETWALRKPNQIQKNDQKSSESRQNFPQEFSFF